MSDTKLVLKCGDIEVHCEGTEDFIKKELPKLIEGIAQLRQGTANPGSGDGAGGGAAAAGFKPPLGSDKLSVSTIAQKLGVKKGPELVMAAALSFALQARDVFTKKDLRDRCREATTFWRKSYANNFDNYMTRLVGWGSLNHTGGTNYALPDDKKAELLSRLKP